MKKTLPLILGLTLLCCSMTACGNKDNSSNNSEAKTSETMNNSNETSGLNSATDASMESESGNNNNNNGNNNNNRFIRYYLKSIIFFQHLNVSFSPITIFSTIILFWDRTDASSCVPSSYRQGRST